MAELLEAIGHNIRRLRDEKGWNQTELGFRAGASPSIISLIENGKRNPSTATLAKIAAALGVEVVDLFPKDLSSPPEPSFTDVLDGERLVEVAEGFTENLRHLTAQWRDETKEPHEQSPYWCTGVQATAIGFTDLFSKLGIVEMIGRKLKEIGDGSPDAFVEEMKKGRDSRAASDRELRAAMNALLAFKEMHEVSDQVLKADETVDWIALEEAAQRKKAFGVIQGALSA